DGTDTCDDGESNAACETETTQGDANNPGPGTNLVTTTQTRTYDHDGQLVEVSFDDGTSTETTGFGWDNNRSIPQIITWTDTTNTNLVYGNTRIAATGGTTGDETFAYNPFADAVASPGSTLAVSDQYGPYGEPAVAGTGIGFGYRSELHVDSQVHVRARDLVPGPARFAILDPLDGREGSVAEAHGYNYAANDPVRHTDPSGLRPMDGSIWAGIGLGPSVPSQPWAPSPGEGLGGPIGRPSTLAEGLGGPLVQPSLVALMFNLAALDTRNKVEALHPGDSTVLNELLGGSPGCPVAWVDGSLTALVLGAEGACGVWRTVWAGGICQACANFAGGVFNGIALGWGDEFLDNVWPSTRGKVNWGSFNSGLGSYIGGALILPLRFNPGFNAFAAFASTASACEDNGGATCATALLLNLSTVGGRGLEASPAVQRLLGGSGTSALSVEQLASIQIGLIFHPFNELTLYTARVYLD
ncbi:MAG: hypothetical protein GY701_16340, partial [Sulfitobacter sp.]|nr:hypothetical protein [Sulfitobacter sp.]